MSRPWFDNGFDNKWNRRFFEMAQLVAGWSKDPSTKVGAVIIDHQRRILSTGYNGFPRGVEDNKDRYLDKPKKYKLIVHAEANAVLNARLPLDGSTLYSTKHPCSDCAKLIIQSGVRHVMCPSPANVEPWLADAQHAIEMFHEAEIYGSYLDPEDLLGE